MSGNAPCNKRKEVKRGDSTDTTLAELKRRASKDPAEYVKWYLVGKTKSVLSWNIIAGADMVVPTALGLAWLGPVISAVQHLVPPNMRATASAIFLFVNNLIGIGDGVFSPSVAQDRLSR